MPLTIGLNHASHQHGNFLHDMSATPRVLPLLVTQLNCNHKAQRQIVVGSPKAARLARAISNPICTHPTSKARRTRLPGWKRLYVRASRRSRWHSRGSSDQWSDGCHQVGKMAKGEDTKPPPEAR